MCLLAQDKERGKTDNITVIDPNQLMLTWERDENYADVIQIRLREKLLPQQKATFKLTYTVKIPSDKFTSYGYGENGKMHLKNCFLIPARYEDKGFVKYNNLNLDDAANSLTDYEMDIKITGNLNLNSDLNITQNNPNQYQLSGNNRLNFSLLIDHPKEYSVYKNSQVEVVSNLRDSRLNDFQRALVIDKIVNYVGENLGHYPLEKITVTQADYDRNPF